jgi:hypothetical protein
MASGATAAAWTSALLHFRTQQTPTERRGMTRGARTSINYGFGCQIFKYYRSTSERSWSILVGVGAETGCKLIEVNEYRECDRVAKRM